MVVPVESQIVAATGFDVFVQEVVVELEVLVQVMVVVEYAVVTVAGEGLFAIHSSGVVDVLVSKNRGVGWYVMDCGFVAAEGVLAAVFVDTFVAKDKWVVIDILA